MASDTNLPTLDHTVLDELASIMDEAFVELLRAFMIDAASIVDRLREARGGGDLAGASQLAHTLKGSSANLGALALSDLCRQLNSGERTGESVDLNDSVTQIETEFRRLEAELTHYIEALGS